MDSARIALLVSALLTPLSGMSYAAEAVQPPAAETVQSPSGRAWAGPISFVTLGVSSFFQPEARKFDEAGRLLNDPHCVPGEVDVPMASVEELLDFNDGALRSAPCFAGVLEAADRHFTDFAEIRCYYNYGRRLWAVGAIGYMERTVIDGIQGPLYDAIDRVVPRIEASLRDIDACFAEHFGLPGWYARYGTAIMSRVQAYSDVELR